MPLFQVHDAVYAHTISVFHAALPRFVSGPHWNMRRMKHVMVLVSRSQSETQDSHCLLDVVLWGLGDLCEIGMSEFGMEGSLTLRRIIYLRVAR